MAWGVAGERRPELERDQSSRGGVVRCKGDGETESAGEVLNEWGEEKKGRKKKGKGGRCGAGQLGLPPGKF
jgi:hypothetical protein